MQVHFAESTKVYLLNQTNHGAIANRSFRSMEYSLSLDTAAPNFRLRNCRFPRPDAVDNVSN